MATRVRDIMVTPAIFVDPLESITRAATLLSENKIEGLVVADEDGWYGIVTTADIREKALFAYQDPDATTVRDIMTPRPPTANPAWPVAFCISLMNRLGTRCIPVVGSEGRIIGIVAPGDTSDSIKYPPPAAIHGSKGQKRATRANP